MGLRCSFSSYKIVCIWAIILESLVSLSLTYLFITPFLLESIIYNYYVILTTDSSSSPLTIQVFILLSLVKLIKDLAESEIYSEKPTIPINFNRYSKSFATSSYDYKSFA